MSRLPVLPARRSRDGRELVVDCPGCGRPHRHGRHRSRSTGCDGRTCTCPSGVADGPRVGDCPWTEYVVVEVEPTTRRAVYEAAVAMFDVPQVPTSDEELYAALDRLTPAQGLAAFERALPTVGSALRRAAKYL